MSTLAAAARDALCALVLDAARSAFGDHLRAAILKGSALKGDFIPGYSDLDIHCFVDRAVMATPELPQLDYAFAFQAAFGGVEPRAYGVNSCQVYFLAWNDYPAGWVRPIPGTYQLIYGELPSNFTEVDPADYVVSSRQYLDGLAKWRETIIGRFLDKPDSQLAPSVRLAGIILKPSCYCVLTVLGGDPFRSWRLPIAEAAPAASAAIGGTGALAAYFREVPKWPEREQDLEWLRQQLRLALDALADAAAWARGRSAATL